MSVNMAVWALPQTSEVAAGVAAITQAGNVLTVSQQSAKAVINWQSFDIGVGERVNFIQPSAGAAILNRVLGPNPSQIFGQLTANGQVFLVNPNGILFAPGAQVNAGSLVAASLAISDQDFLSGRYQFISAGRAGAISNQGTLTAADGGYVILAGAKAENMGLITVNKGTAGLAAGAQMLLDIPGNNSLQLQVSQAVVDAAVVNAGSIRAAGGYVVLDAQALGNIAGTVINNSGIIEANSLDNREGVIYLNGGQVGEIKNTGRLYAGDKIMISGQKISLSGAEIASGRDITLTANSMSLEGGATLRGSGELTLQPLSAGWQINLGEYAHPNSNFLQLDNKWFALNTVSGFKQLLIGRGDIGGTISIKGNTYFHHPVTLRAIKIEFANEGVLETDKDISFITNDFVFGDLSRIRGDKRLIIQPYYSQMGVDIGSPRNMLSRLNLQNFWFTSGRFGPGFSEIIIRGKEIEVINANPFKSAITLETAANSSLKITGSLSTALDKDIKLSAGSITLAPNSGIKTSGAGEISLTANSDINLGSYASIVTQGQDITLMAANIMSSNSAGIDAGGGDITLTADSLKLNGAVQSNGGSLTLQPRNPAETIGVGTASGQFQLPVSLFGDGHKASGVFKDGFTAITIGRPDGTGTIQAGGITLLDNLRLLSPGTGGTITLTGPMGMQGNDLTLMAYAINAPASYIENVGRLALILTKPELPSNPLPPTDISEPGGLYFSSSNGRVDKIKSHLYHSFTEDNEPLPTELPKIFIVEEAGGD